VQLGHRLHLFFQLDGEPGDLFLEKLGIFG
jgi:hypothetical protein